MVTSLLETPDIGRTTSRTIQPYQHVIGQFITGYGRIPADMLAKSKLIVTKPDNGRTEAGQNRTKPDTADAHQPDKTGHTPLGVSGCPGGLSGVRLSGSRSEFATDTHPTGPNR